MKSCWIRADGGKTAFEFRDVPVPEPAAGEVLVRVRASAMNRGELLASIGWHRAEVPKRAGRELAGEVCALGAGVSAFGIGQRVMARAHGAFAEYVAVPAGLVMPVPDRMTWEQAAAVPIAFITAHVSLFTYGRVKSGDWVLVAGAASGVGVACVQLAKFCGARVIGTSRSEDKLRKLSDIGLDVAIHAGRSSFVEPVLRATDGAGASVAVNLVGGSVFRDCVGSLANQGRLVITGYVDGVTTSDVDLQAVHAKRLEISGVSNTHLTPAERFEGTRTFLRDVMPGFESGALSPIMDKVFSFDDLVAAKAYVEADAHVGKVIVRMS